MIGVRQVDGADNAGAVNLLDPVTIDLTVAAPTADVDDTTGASVTGLAELGATVTVYAANGTTVLGTGTANLTTGAYSVTLDTAQTNGETLQVRQTDIAGNISGATNATAPDQFVAVDNEADFELTVTPTQTAQALDTGVVGQLADVGLLGPLVNLTVLQGSSVLAFTVAENTTRQVSVEGEGLAVATLALTGDYDFDLLIYRVADGGTQGELFGTAKDWLDFDPGLLGLLFSSWDGAELALPEFEGGYTYYLVVGNPSTGLLDLSLISGMTISTTSDVIVDYNPDVAVSGSYSGNVITDAGAGGTDAAPPGTVVTSVNGTNVTGADTPIPGTYGTLTIDPDGTYTYTPDPTFTGNYGDTESFAYTITRPGGATETATLTVTLDFGRPDAPQDVETTGTAVTGTGEPGATVTVYGPDGTTVLGTDTVENNGTFSVTLSPPQTNGEMLSVTQTDAAGNTSSATWVEAPDALVAVGNNVVLELDVTPEVTDNGTQNGVVLGLLSLGVLGGVVPTVDLTTAAAMIVTVGEGMTRDISLTGAGAALINISTGDSDLDLAIYRAANGALSAELVEVHQDWMVYDNGPIGLGPFTWTGDEQVLDTFEGGYTYYIVIGNDAAGLLDLGLLQGLSVTTTSDVTTDYNTPIPVTGSASGNVIDDAGPGAVTPVGTVVSDVNGDPVTGLDTLIDGEFGTLTIDPDGTYTYTPDATFTGEFGDQDIFTYTLTGPGGDIETATLTITLDMANPAGFAPFMASFAFSGDSDLIPMDIVDDTGTTDNPDKPGNESPSYDLPPDGGDLTPVLESYLQDSPPEPDGASDAPDGASDAPAGAAPPPPAPAEAPPDDPLSYLATTPEDDLHAAGQMAI